MKTKQNNISKINAVNSNNNCNSEKFIDKVDLGVLGVGAVGLITIVPYLLPGETIFGITITKQMVPIMVSKIPSLATAMTTTGISAIGGTLIYELIKDYAPNVKSKFANKKICSPKELKQPVFNFNQIFQFSATKDKN